MTPPTFVVPAVAALRHAVYFCVTMVAHQAWGWVFLATFSFYCYRALVRLGSYVEARVRAR